MSRICICTTPIRPEPSPVPPFGAMAIIQSLQMIGEKPEFYHIDYFRPKEDEIIQYFEENQFDIVGISSIVSTAYVATKKLAQIIKKVNSKTCIIVGGNIVSSANVLLAKLPIDFCVIGEGEIIIQNLVRAITKGNLNDEVLGEIRGISFIDSKGNFRFTGFETPLSAEKILTPDFTILEKTGCLDYYMPSTADWNKKLDTSVHFENNKTAVVITSKGCVGRCTFCPRLEKGYRVLPTERVIEHLKLLKEKYSVGILDIQDENFGSNKSMTRDLVKKLGEMGFAWRAAGVRVDTVDKKTLKYWAANGCKLVSYGIETGSLRMLSVMEKKISLRQNLDAIRWTYEAGLPTYFIKLVIGMPGEDDSTIKETIAFLIKCMPYYPNVSRKRKGLASSINYAQALPGSPLYEYAREKGYIHNTIDAEEQYLIRISDVDASSIEHFINCTKQPFLKVLSWKYWINWELFRYHAKNYLGIAFTRTQKIRIYLIEFLHIFSRKAPKNIAFFKILAQQNKNKRIERLNDYFNLKSKRLSVLLPWNRYTYPFIVILIAWKKSQSIREFLDLIIHHLIWSINIFRKKSLPDKSLRKIVNISDNDETVLLRKGR